MTDDRRPSREQDEPPSDLLAQLKENLKYLDDLTDDEWSRITQALELSKRLRLDGVSLDILAGLIMDALGRSAPRLRPPEVGVVIGR